MPALFSRQLPDHSPQERPRREARPAMADADEVQDPLQLPGISPTTFTF